MKETLKEQAKLLLLGAVFALAGSFLAYLAHLASSNFVARANYNTHLISHQEVKSAVVNTADDIAEIKEDLRWLKRNSYKNGKLIIKGGR